MHQEDWRSIPAECVELALVTAMRGSQSLASRLRSWANHQSCEGQLLFKATLLHPGRLQGDFQSSRVVTQAQASTEHN